MSAEPTLYEKLRWHAGRGKRWIKRRAYERSVGKEYRIWLAQAKALVPGSVDNAVPLAVIVPVYNPPVEFLRECVDSVLAQSARNWQLIVSDDGSTDPQVQQFLDEFAQAKSDDSRIIVLRGENGGISAAQNKAIERVTTTHFGWLDHDDALDPRCFAECSQTLTEHPDALIVYSDEDKFDAKGKHYEVYCKPDFSPELLLTQMYLCHFTVFHTDTVRELGGFRSEMDGAQDFDLALRFLPRLRREPERVQHIALPLYHWRAWSESTALSIDAKPWAQEAAARAQQVFLDANNGGEVEPSRIRGLNDVHPKIVAEPTVSVIIPTIGTRGGRDKTRMVDDAVASLKAATRIPIEVIAVTTGVIEDVAGVDQQVVYECSDFNFAEAVNRGRAHAKGEYLLILNDDTTVAEGDPIGRMLELAQVPGVGIVGAKLTYPNGKLQHVGIVMLPTTPRPGDATPLQVAADVKAAHDAGLDLIRLVAHVAHPAVYDTADELGMLLWQEMPIRGVMARGVRAQAERQAREMVDLLGHHPSVAVWCTHDEPFKRQPTPQPTPPVIGQQRPSWNRAILDTSVRRVLQRTDGSRPVVIHTAVPPHLPQLDGTTSHLWFGWHGGQARDLAGALGRIPRMGRFVTAFGAATVADEFGF